MDLALNNLQRLIGHKTQTTKQPTDFTIAGTTSTSTIITDFNVTDITNIETITTNNNNTTN